MSNYAKTMQERQQIYEDVGKKHLYIYIDNPRPKNNHNIPE